MNGLSYPLMTATNQLFSKAMEKQVIYNFLVVNGAIASPTSSLDGQNGIVEFEDVSGSITQHINGPVVVVKVIDWRAKCKHFLFRISTSVGLNFMLAVYTWDLVRFRKQLMKMRHIYALKEKPNYSVHFEVDSPFTDVPPPSYSFIGSAKIPLRLLGKQLSYAVTVPIMCQYTMEAVGSCRVTFKVELLDDMLGRSPRIASDRLFNGSISPGSRLTFIFIVDSVKGLSSTDYASIHAQTRLSSLIGPSIVSEDTFASQPVDLDKSSGTLLILKKSMSVVVTPEIIQYMTNEYAIVEFFAKAKNEYLGRLERWDVNHEVHHPIVSTSTPGTPTKSGDNSNPLMRRCETEFVAPERHDILAVISILELASNGEYVPAEVYDDVFQLCQGLQRRLHIKLVHSSGKALPWEKMEHISTGDIRLVDKDGAASVGKPLVELKISDQVVAYHADGTSSLDAEGVWDTASHSSRHLDRRTLPGQHLLIRLTWLVTVPTLSEPVIFHVDLPVKILGRGAKRPSFLTFWSASKMFKSMTKIFIVECAPPIARSANELWRLDTSGKHVEGEETLGSWKPRSLGLLNDWKRMCKAQMGLAEVALTKRVLEVWREEVEEGSEGGKEDEQDESDEQKRALVSKYLDLWHSAIENRVEVNFSP